MYGEESYRKSKSSGIGVKTISDYLKNYDPETRVIVPVGSIGGLGGVEAATYAKLGDLGEQDMVLVESENYKRPFFDTKRKALWKGWPSRLVLDDHQTLEKEGKGLWNKFID